MPSSKLLHQNDVHR